MIFLIISFLILFNLAESQGSVCDDVENSDCQKSNLHIIIGIVVGVILLILAAVLFFIHRRRKNKKSTDFEKPKGTKGVKPVEPPSKKDLWELERRNLIIYDDKKLGSGTFGAVYLGKLIGKAEGSKDAQSTLGIDLIRAENCPVAVKMLPKYADDISKSDFLQEIGLMKKLGYHERLVNMMGCITDSEPYCLVVEYCSDGDLLNFLKKRCNYMMALNEQNIDYTDPYCEYELDIEMIMTVKQLLMFAFQISCGLEYLAQKGFVHRDVAARNILVHEETLAKIGDFGLCRYVYTENSYYISKGGKLPIKWMSPEAIRYCTFTSKSDVWSFGILMFELITLGGMPYPGIHPDEMLNFLESGNRIPQPDNCPDEFYDLMKTCWAEDPKNRPDFSFIRSLLTLQLEEITEEYYYLKLDAQKDYYKVCFKEQNTENQTADPPDATVGDSEVDVKEKTPKKSPTLESRMNSEVLEDNIEDFSNLYESPIAVYAMLEEKQRHDKELKKLAPSELSMTSSSSPENKPEILE